MPKYKINEMFLKPDGTIDVEKFKRAYYTINHKYKSIKDAISKHNAKNSLYDMAYLIGHKDLHRPLHGQFTDFVTKKNVKRKMYLMPRKHFKTTVGTIDNVCYRIVDNPLIKILIASSTRDLARDMLAGIKIILESNENFKQYCGDFQGKAVWNRNEILVKQAEKCLTDNTFTVETAGIDETVTGKHPDLIIFDDTVSRNNCKSADQRKKVKDFFDETTESLLKQGGEVLVLGTRWHYDDLYNNILTEDNIDTGGRFECIVRSAIERWDNIDNIWNGKVIFPTMFSKEEYKALEKKNEYMFWSNYMNYPRASKDKPMNPMWMEYYDALPERITDWVILIDPASSENDWSDGTAVVVAGRYKSNIIIVDLYKDKIDSNEIIKVACDMHRKYTNAKTIYVEDAGNQAHLINFFITEVERMKRKGLVSKELEVESVMPHSRAKDDRIYQFRSFLKNKTYLFPKNCIRFSKYEEDNIDMLKELKNEMDEYPLSDKDDLMDGCAYLLDIYDLHDEDVQAPIFIDKKSKACDNANGKGKCFVIDEQYEQDITGGIVDNDLEEIKFLE